MDHHCSSPLWIEDMHIFTCIMVNNDTFIAYYSYPVGLTCPPIQHLHDITEANKGGKGMWFALEEQYGCHILSESWKKSLRQTPLHCPKTGLFWVQLYCLLRRGGNLGDAASEFVYTELPLPSLQPSGSFWAVGTSLSVGLYHAKLDNCGEQLGMQDGLSSALDFVFLICVRKAN